ncbi:MAG: PepSY domain-containing protein [Bdellovibrionales bacterium]|nr:PepSY domain-containing protein [Bdellovibrionales bacterium]
MKKILLVTLLMSLSVVAYAKKNCTDQTKDKWMSEADFKKKVEADGYKIRKFKQPGTCYEIYGTNKDGKEVEIYFNPVDASIVKSE